MIVSHLKELYLKKNVKTFARLILDYNVRGISAAYFVLHMYVSCDMYVKSLFESASCICKYSVPKLSNRCTTRLLNRSFDDTSEKQFDTKQYVNVN